MLDADVVMSALGQQLILDFDGGEPGGLRHGYGAVHVHGVAPAPRGVQDQGQAGHGADFQSRMHHFREVEIGLQHRFCVTGGPAAQIERLVSRGFGHFRHQRIEHQRRAYRVWAGDHFP